MPEWKGGRRSWIRAMIRKGVGSAVLGLLVVIAEIVAPRVAERVGLAAPHPPWQEAPLPYLTLGIALPLFTTTLLFLAPWRLARIAACALHAWLLLLAALSALSGVVALLTIVLVVPGLALILTALVFGANSAVSIVMAFRDVAAISRPSAAGPT
jgi:hypothetical protein